MEAADELQRQKGRPGIAGLEGREEELEVALGIQERERARIKRTEEARERQRVWDD